ncbi:DUF6932 family protein [Paenibacillus sp. GCM10028914]|uniref:DUF6932 family protein n=1 Tax=Paenibacillus sp. GCM10028914 TaxID=3273416 RepID=UPI00360E3F4A
MKDGNSLLPDGVYDCTLDELRDIFTSIPNKEKRKQLFEQLLLYVEQIKRAGIPCCHLLIDGSYVTNKEEPSDIDLAIVTPWDYSPDFRMSSMNDLTAPHDVTIIESVLFQDAINCAHHPL